jgi:hypothetical protein
MAGDTSAVIAFGVGLKLVRDQYRIHSMGLLHGPSAEPAHEGIVKASNRGSARWRQRLRKSRRMPSLRNGVSAISSAIRAARRPIEDFRRNLSLGGRDPAVFPPGPKKTAAPAGMAGNALLIHQQ